MELKNLFSESWSDIWIFNVKSNNKSTPFLVMTPENLTLIDSPQKNLLRWKDYFKTTKYHLKTTSKLLQRNLELLSRQVDLNDYDHESVRLSIFIMSIRGGRRGEASVTFNSTLQYPFTPQFLPPPLCVFSPLTLSQEFQVIFCFRQKPSWSN